MDALGKLLEAVFLPPGLVAVLLAVGLFLTLRGSRRAWVPVAAALAVLLALSVSPVSKTLAGALERAYPPLGPDADYDLIVVLAGGALGGSPEEPDGASLSPTSLRRVTYGYDVYKRKPRKIVVTGGGRAGDGGPTEAALMLRRLEGFDVFGGDIVFDDTSMNTMQSATVVAKYARRNNLSRPVLVTSAAHMPRAVRAFRKAGLKPIAAPTDYRSGGPWGWRGFLPSAESLSLGMSSLHELFGRAYYAVAYR